MSEQIDTPDRTQDLAARLAKLRGEREEAAAAREAAEAEQRLLAEIEEQETAIADERAIAAAVAEHGVLGKRIGAIRTPGIGVVIVKRPHHVFFRKWSDENLGKEGAIPNDALEDLVRHALVHPDRVEFGRYVQEQPAMLARAANAVVKLAGARGQELSGKS